MPQKCILRRKGGFSTATDIAEYLVKKGMPFRQAHEIVGKIVAYCLKNKKGLENLTLKEYQKFYDGFTEDIQGKYKTGKCS